jgi:CheY-like chemotaxis protein
MSNAILIVEDDDAIREALVAVLESAGHPVLAARDGEEALAELSGAVSVSLILLDLWMPVMDGWEFRARQRRDPAVAGVPVIVVTADLDAERSSTDFGAVDWIAKPFEMDHLLAVVQRHC